MSTFIIAVTYLYFFFSLHSRGVYADAVIYNIQSRICKMRVSLLDIIVCIMFLLTIFVRLLRLLFVICILGNEHFEHILNFWAFFGYLV
jgi:hypothetical protein